MDELELRAALTTFLAAHDRTALLTLVLSGAELVLPLLEANRSTEERLWRALKLPWRREEMDYAQRAAQTIWFFDSSQPTTRDAALAVYYAATLPFGYTDRHSIDLLITAARSVHKTAQAVDRVLVAASAQERLDFVAHRLEGFFSFDAWLARRLESAGGRRG